MNLIKKKTGCFIMDPISASVLVLGIVLGYLLATPEDKGQQKKQLKQVQFESDKNNSKGKTLLESNIQGL